MSSVASSLLLEGDNLKSKPNCAENAHDRVQPWLSVRAKRFVKRLALQSGIQGDRCHSLGPHNRAERSSEDSRIAIIHGGLQKLRHISFVFEVTGCIETLSFNAVCGHVDSV